MKQRLTKFKVNKYCWCLFFAERCSLVLSNPMFQKSRPTFMFNFHIPVENLFQQLETPNAQMLGTVLMVIKMRARIAAKWAEHYSSLRSFSTA